MQGLACGLAAAGVPGFEAYVHLGFAVPAQTSEDRVVILEQAIAPALAPSQAREKPASFGMEALDVSWQAYGGLIQGEILQHRELTEALKLKVY